MAATMYIFLEKLTTLQGRLKMFVYFLYEFCAHPTWGRGSNSHQWLFENALYQAKKSNGVVIASQRYFDWLRQKEESPSELKPWHFKTANPSDLSIVRFYEIPSRLDNTLIENCGGSWTKAWTHILTNCYEPLICWLEETIADITSSGESIEGFHAFTPYPSLKKVAKSREIPIIHIDIAPIRNPVYKTSLGYLDFKGTQGAANEAADRYKAFKKETDASFASYILSPKEILALFLSDEHLHMLEKYHQEPVYEWGIALHVDLPYVYAFSNFYTQNEFLFDVNVSIDTTKSLIRSHPGDWYTVNPAYWPGAIDTSPDTETFILQCRHIAATWGKTAFSAMLWGRFTHIIKSPNSPFLPGGSQTLKTEDSIQPDDDFISFLTFGYFVPLKYLNDPDYLRWRISNPPETEIYKKNLSYYFAQIGIDLDIYTSIPYPEVRLAYLLSVRNQQHTRSYLPVKSDSAAITEGVLESYRQEIQSLNLQISALTLEKEALRCEVNALLSSTSWAITKPIRLVKKAISRIF